MLTYLLKGSKTWGAPTNCKWSHKSLSMNAVRFNRNPIVNQMAYGYQSMAGLNQRIVDEYSACQYESIFNLNKYYDEIQ
ncbi:hypothetical protein M3M39_07255 [Fructilactobacillus hinvesii]|uniref:Transposase n=1 Tax=Fructilactobacillus hinvesii TaxID=2940300 RepID=A0ABY5BRX9_9LACO|nr:hypothetical protein [Fructilactobacillus hinvesii]USS87878.1 hypothetical protein M3M39_07255 [Fructilactobacillus hinvesii]